MIRFLSFCKNYIHSRRSGSLGTTPTLTARTPSCSEKTPLLQSSVNYEYDGGVINDEREDLENSEQHKAKDFQLIHVPKGAVSIKIGLKMWTEL